jgi:hypothetical protein
MPAPFIPRSTFHVLLLRLSSEVPRGPSSAVGGKTLSFLCVLCALSEAGEK